MSDFSSFCYPSVAELLFSKARLAIAVKLKRVITEKCHFHLQAADIMWKLYTFYLF